MTESPEVSWPQSLKDRFEFISELGSGGLSRVFLVQDKNSGGSQFALKILKTSKVNPKNIARFKEEFEILRGLNHEFIVKANELISLEDTQAILMEAVKGRSLLEIILEQKLSIPEIEKIFSGILLGLDSLHSKNLAHRDLKLENVIVDKNFEPKLIDFGFFKRVEGISEDDFEGTIGTVQYLAPEYIKHNHYDYRSDLYSVALMLYECVAGRRWLAGKTPEESLQYLYEINFEFPKLALAGLPVKFQHIIERGLSIQPWKRFDNAKTMRLAILSENGSEKPFQQVSVQENVNIQVVNSRRKTQQFLSVQKKRKDKLILATLIFVLTILGIASVAIFLSPEKKSKQPPEKIEPAANKTDFTTLQNQQIPNKDLQPKFSDLTSENDIQDWSTFDERHMLENTDEGQNTN